MTLSPRHKAIFDALERDAEGLARRMVMAIREEVEEYRTVRDPKIAAEVLAHAVEHVHVIARCGRAGRVPEGAELDFVRQRGATRARQMMPLDALLESYLIGQRTTWETIAEVAGDSPEGMRIAQDLTAWTFRYTHAINVAIAAAYLTESHVLASESERSRRDLLDRLLSGLLPGFDEERRAEGLGLRPEAEHIVVVATQDGGSHGERLVVRGLVPHDPFVVARHDEIVAIVPARDGRGPRELRDELTETLAAIERNHGVRIRAGVSTTCTGLAEVARAYAEARRTLRHADPVAILEEISLFDYLAQSADETAQRLAPPGLHQLAPLAGTLHAYAECDLNVAKTAEHLEVHPNTVHYRLRRVQELTGRDPRRFGDLVELTTALRVLKPGTPLR
jgi:hypothetical protein